MTTTTKTSVGIVIFAGCIILMLILSTVLILTHGYFLEATEPTARKFYFEELEEGVRVKWQKPSEMYDDNLGYEVTYKSTMGKYSTITDSATITVPIERFCYFFDIQITTLPILYRRSIIGSTRYYETISNVQDLQLIPSVERGIVAILWTNDPLQQQCNLTYEVSIESSDIIDTITVSDSSAIFNLIYCINATVNVRTIFDNRKSEGSARPYPEVYPTWLEPVNNVSITTNAATAVLSWEISTSLKQCTNLFTVIARNEESDDQNECQGVTGCKIILPTTFCPYSQFIIRPTAPFEGDKIERRYSCAQNGFV